MAAKKKGASVQHKVAAENRKARHAYEIGDTMETGVMLQGTEVKSLRDGRSNIAESYASIENGELWLINSYIPIYNAASRFNHAPRRPRKLLVHARELAKLHAAVQRDGMTLVPLKLYFNDKGRAKLELAIAKGRKAHDKREADKKRDWQRDKARIMRERG
ncbi:SsrA-binding protein SmpB [Pyruvatibacter sp. HU-CL02332]|uniref:SsrA-binding protein SmpB n=1 Tax=Pyruvatibacter sp. HU-CL02332 TaxID=3127650 RepID=UPI002968E974|nr:SsrA-binding protein SmpB [Alphaproteobacteria bacterium]